MGRIVLYILAFSFVLQACNSTTQFQKLDKIYQVAEYEKVLSKADRLIKNNPADPIPFYFKAMTELFLYTQTKRPEQLEKSLQNINRAQRKRIPDYLATDLENLIDEALMVANAAILEYETTLPNTASTLKSLTSKISNAEKPVIVSTPIKTKPKEIEYKSVEGIRGSIVEVSKQFLGIPYRYGGTTSEGFDCSGFTSNVFLEVGITIPRTAAQQSKAGLEVSKRSFRPGDLVFFSKMPGGAGINHVAIIIEADSDGIKAVIHSTNRGVVIDKSTSGSWTSYWAPRVKMIATYIDD